MLRRRLVAALGSCIVFAACSPNTAPMGSPVEAGGQASLPLDSHQGGPPADGGGCVASPNAEFAPDSYVPNAPERRSTGKGMRITGTVRAVDSCVPIPYARVEIWHETPQGGYSDKYRSIVTADKDGSFSYSGPALERSTEGRTHVHFLARADNFSPGVVTVEPSTGQPQVIDVLIVLAAGGIPDSVAL